MYYGRDTFLIRAAGSSMEPLVRDGDYVYVDPDESAVDGHLVAVRDGKRGQTAVRMLVENGGRRWLRALQPDWPARIVAAANETDILGVVVFVGRKV